MGDLAVSWHGAPFNGEGYRKVRAWLAHRGLTVEGKRVLRLMRHHLLAPWLGPPNGDPAHTATITTARGAPNRGGGSLTMLDIETRSHSGVGIDDRVGTATLNRRCRETRRDAPVRSSDSAPLLTTAPWAPMLEPSAAGTATDIHRQLRPRTSHSSGSRAGMSIQD
jgi:hypothetical protein